MHSPPRKVSIQITGSPSTIERQLELGRLRDARRCELHGKVWIELPAISDDELISAVADGCQVHFYDHAPGWTT
jgi:hypothetical protein